MLAGLPLAVEFRNKSWFGDKTRERTLAFERERGLAHVVVDEPQGFPSSVPQVWEVTCPSLRWFGCTAETARPGRRKAWPLRPSASTTCIPRASSKRSQRR